MKLFHCIFLLVSILSLGQSKNYSATWDSIQNNLTKRHYAQANQFIQEVRIKARKAGDRPEYLFTLFKEVEVLSSTYTSQPLFIDKATQLLLPEIHSTQPVEKAILNHYFANLLYNRIGINPIKENNQSKNFTDWSTLNKIKYVDSLLVESVKDHHLLAQEKSENWKLILTSNHFDHSNHKIHYPHFEHYNTYSIAPTLLHVLGNWYLNGIGDLFDRYITDQKLKYTLLNNKTSALQDRLAQLNEEKNYRDAKAYQYYINLGYNRNHTKFDDLMIYAKSHPADFNAYIFYQNLTTRNYEYGYNRQFIPEVLQNLNQALALYPQTIWTKNLIELKKKLVRPLFEVDVPEHYASQRYIPLKINGAKTDVLYLKVYKNSHPLDKIQTNFNYDTIAQTYQTDASLIYEEKIQLKAFDDYLSHETLYKINPLETGKYQVIISNNPAYKNDDEQLIVKELSLNITDWFVQLFEIGETKNGIKYKAQFIHRTTGNPLKNKKVVLYNDGAKKDYDRVKTLTTNQAGEIYYTSNDNSDLKEDLDVLYAYIPSTKEFISFEDYDLSEIEKNETTATIEKSATTLLDRAIYRPGQEVYFKTIAYEKDTHKGKVLPKIDLHVYLHDSNQQKIDSLSLTTNGYGSINGQFKLPEETLNGNYSLQIIANKKHIGYKTFRVEEYKRPTFRIKIDQPDAIYQSGDTAIFKGKVESLSGAPLNNVQIKYTIKENWNRIKNDSLTTDAQGEFYIKTPLNQDKKYQTLTIDATAIHPTGESQETTFNYKFGSNPYQLSIQSSAVSINTEWKDIFINTESLNGKFTPLKGDITIYQIPEVEGIYGKHYYDFSRDYDVLSTAQLKAYFPHYNLKNKEENDRYWKNYPVIQTSTFDTNEKKFVEIHQPEKLKRGTYLIEAFSVIEQDTIQTHKIVKIAEDESYRFSEKEFLTVKFSKNDYQVGDTYQITFETDWKEDGSLFLYEQEENSFQKATVIPFKNGKAIFEKKVTQELIDLNYQLSYLFIRNEQYDLGRLHIPTIQNTHHFEVKTEVFRDKIRPGETEKWKLKITHPSDQKVNAEVLATMYDASLDQFSSNQFQKINWSKWSNYPFNVNDMVNHNYETTGLSQYRKLKHDQPLQFYFPQLNTKAISKFRTFAFDYNRVKSIHGNLPENSYIFKPETSVDYLLQGRVAGISFNNYDEDDISLNEVVTKSFAVGTSTVVNIRGINSINATTQPLYVVDGVIQETFNVDPSLITTTTVLKDASATALYGSRGANGVIVITTKQGEGKETIDLSQLKTRTNLNETAFFYPTLYTDEAGNVSFEFTSPEALTEWKLLVFAHDQNINTGTGSFTTKTQKDLMVAPHLPRFLRTGDQIVLSTQIQNISASDLAGQARLELMHPQTNEVINNLFEIVNNQQSFEVKSKQSTLVEWQIKVPEDLEDVIVKIVAGTATFSDGEQQILPILGNSIELTEVESYVIAPNETQTITIQPASVSNNFKFSIDTNPLFQLLTTVEKLTSYPYDCTEQTTSKWYAYQIIHQLKKKYPSIETAFDQLKTDPNFKTAFEESIAKTKNNWVREATHQREQLIALAKLMNDKDNAKEIKKLEQKILASQLKDGSFPWFEGGKTNVAITEQILIYMGRTIEMNPEGVSTPLHQAFEKGLQFLIDHHLQEIEKSSFKKDLNTYVDLLYIHQLVPTNKTTLEKLKTIYAKEWKNLETVAGKSSLSQRAKSAIVAKSLAANHYAQNIINSLKTEMIGDKHSGNYWKDPYHYFLETPLSTQALLIEAFQKNNESVDGLVQWVLLKNKQQKHTTTLNQNYTLTAFMKADIKEPSKNEIRVEGLDAIESNEILGQRTYQTKSIDQLPKTINVTNRNKLNSYATILTTKNVTFDQLKPHQTQLRVERELFVEEKGNWTPVQRPIRLGEEIKIRLTLIANESISYVHLKDLRAAGFEPVYQPSGYVWNRMMPYYFEIKDQETNFFIDQLPIGTHVFEYSVKANHLGKFSSGVAQAESMYNPNYQTHSKSSIFQIIK